MIMNENSNEWIMIENENNEMMKYVKENERKMKWRIIIMMKWRRKPI